MEGLACLKDHLEVTMSGNRCLMAAVDEFAASIKRNCFVPSIQSTALAKQTDFFMEQLRLLNSRIQENIANIEAVVARQREIASSRSFPGYPLMEVIRTGGTIFKSQDTHGCQDCVVLYKEHSVESKDGANGNEDKLQCQDGVALEDGDRKRSSGRREMWNPEDGGKRKTHEKQTIEEEVALRLCHLDDVSSDAVVKDLRRATVLEAVAFLCEDEADKRRILKHLMETDDECSLRLLEGVICKKYVEVRLLQQNLLREEQELLLQRLAKDWEQPAGRMRRLNPDMDVDLDLPIVKGEILYLIDEFDLEVEKFRVTVSEIAQEHRALHKKSLEVQDIQEGLLCKGQPRKRREAKCKTVTGGREAPNLLWAAKERNVKLQCIINDQSLKIRTMMAELQRGRSPDREEIETELRKVGAKLDAAMGVVRAKTDEASQCHYDALRKLEELHEAQEELLEVLAVTCDNFGVEDEAEADGPLDELRSEIECLEAEFGLRNARTLDLVHRFQGELPETALSPVYIECEASTGRSFASIRRKVAALKEETAGCTRGLLECIRQQEASDGVVKKLRRLVLDDPRQPQKETEVIDLQLEFLERKLAQIVDSNEKMVDDAEDLLLLRTQQLEEYAAQLAEAECRLERNKEVLEAVDTEEDLDPEKILNGSVRQVRTQLGGVLERLDTCLQATAEMLARTEEMAQRGLVEEALEEHQLVVSRKAQEAKESLQRQILSKSEEFEAVHKELEEVRKAKMRLGNGEVDELQRLLLEIKELKLRMVLNATRGNSTQSGDLGRMLGHEELLKIVAHGYKDFQAHVSSLKDSLVQLQGTLKVANGEVKEIGENLVKTLLEGDVEDPEVEEPEVKDELVVKDLITKILQERAHTWQSTETWQRTETRKSGGDESSYCHKVLEMCLKVDVIQDDILHRLQAVSREQTQTRFRQQEPEIVRRPRTRWINTEGLAAAIFPQATSQRAQPAWDATRKQMAKHARQNTVLKALLKHTLTRAAILQEALAKTKVANVDALPQHKWLKENGLLRDLVAQLMDEVLLLQNKLACR